MLTLALAAFAVYAAQPAHAKPTREPEPGQLTMIDKAGRATELCPLKGTAVNAEIAGFGARVNVVQTFINPSATPIEAIYTFPLPADAAVDRMRIKIGSRIIEGQIKRREEARRIYEAAKNAGQSAALLDQERPNIFTQSVANIMPNAEVKIEISYVQILKYEKGEFEFNFPMVVGPRFLGNAQDAGKIAPVVTPKGTRTGANIDLTVTLDAGAPIQAMNSVLHQVDIKREGDEAATVRLRKRDEIPNRDFILRYRTATDSVQSAFVTCYDGQKGGFFSLILLPPKAPKAQQISPREMIFVMDQSGSQGGFPIEKSKELTLKLIKTMRPDDTFNVFGFNNTVRGLFPSPKPVNAENIAEAEKFVKGMQANGGTQLLEGLNAALKPMKDPRRLRVVVFNTDGFVGDEPQILDTIVKSRDTTRIFTFGIGNGVNRFLIDSMSAEGRGDSEVVTLAESADGAVDRFLQRTQSPILTDVSAKFDGVEITDALPSAIPDVFSEKPIVIMGRYENPGQGKLILSGRLGGERWSKALNLRFPSDPGTSCVSTLWARKKVDDLQGQNYLNMVTRRAGDPLTNKIIDVALDYGIMTQYTSFVAVEPKVINVGGRQHTVRVPVEMADGVSYETTLGAGNRNVNLRFQTGQGLTRGAAGASGGFAGGGPGAPASVNKLSAMTDKAKSPARERKADRLEEAQAAAGKDLTTAEKRKVIYESVVDKALRTAKGQVSVMVWMQSIDDSILAELKKHGLKVEVTDKKLVMVFGTCDAKALEALAQVEAVDRIEPLK